MDTVFIALLTVGIVLTLGTFATKVVWMAIGGKPTLRTPTGQWLFWISRFSAALGPLALLAAIAVSGSPIWVLLLYMGVAGFFMYLSINSVIRVRQISEHSLTDRLWG